jgi:phosphoglycolate phosphatase
VYIHFNINDIQKQPMEIEHTIIWDWNGTLLDDLELCIRSMNKMLQARQLPHLDIERYRNVFTFPVMEYYTAIGFDFDKESWDVAAHEFIEHYLESLKECRLTSGATDVLQYFKSKGYRQAIISAMQHDSLLQSVDHLGIASYLDYIGGIGDHYANSKIVNALDFFKENNLSPGKVTLIGDTLHDAEVASELGCKCILVANGHQSADRLKASGHIVINTLNEIIPLFNN